MMKQYRYTSRDYKFSEPTIDATNGTSNHNIKEEISEKPERNISTLGPENIDNLDLFFTLLLKNLTSKERDILLNKLINTDWENNKLEDHLSELINKKKSDENLKKSLDYEYFLWDFNNWKNYFLAENTD